MRVQTRMAIIFSDCQLQECPECGIEIDRDTNAAINIRNFALRDTIKISNTDGRLGINAFGVGSSDRHDVSRVCETTDNELGKFSGIKSENGNHFQ